MKIQFRKPYERVKQGQVINSMIAYGSWPETFKEKNFNDGTKRVVPATYRRYLLIDLWVVKLIFNF